MEEVDKWAAPTETNSLECEKFLLKLKMHNNFLVNTRFVFFLSRGGALKNAVDCGGIII